MIKKTIALIIVIIMVVSTTTFAAYAASPEEAGLIPVRAIFEEAGATVTWQPGDASIHINLQDISIILHTTNRLLM